MSIDKQDRTFSQSTGSMSNSIEKPEYACSAEAPAQHVSDLGTATSRDPIQEEVLVSVVLPCLNESRTLAGCIAKAHSGCMAFIEKSKIGANEDSSSTALKTYEILVADNGSSDGSREIAEQAGARVLHVQQKGYGAALRAGIAAARGKYVVMGDSDSSYDFSEVPRFLEKLEEDFDLVMGNRFSGHIEPGAMPWHHRFVGNPILSGIGRILYGSPCRDWHCGLRGFRREKLLSLGLKTSGMEFASEMMIFACQAELRLAEISITLYRDGRDRPPHLRSFRDGLRHLSILLFHCRQKWLAMGLLMGVLLLLALRFFPQWETNETGEKQLAAIANRERSSLTHDFGFVEPESENSCEFILTNNTTIPWSISKVSTSCACTVAELSSEIAKPSESIYVRVAYRASTHQGSDRKEIIVRFKDREAKAMKLIVTSSIRNRMSIHPELLTFHASMDAESEKEVQVTNYGERPWSELKLLDSDFMTVLDVKRPERNGNAQHETWSFLIRVRWDKVDRTRRIVAFPIGLEAITADSPIAARDSLKLSLILAE